MPTGYGNCDSIVRTSEILGKVQIELWEETEVFQ